MGFFSSLFGGLFGDESSGYQAPAAPTKPDTPDYKSLWKTYQGWLDNINVNSNKQMAEVRARLAASGASGDVISRQVEFLEGQRQSQIKDIEEGATAQALKEGYAIATGKMTNPYATDLAGMGITEEATRKFKEENFKPNIEEKYADGGEGGVQTSYLMMNNNRYVQMNSMEDFNQGPGLYRIGTSEDGSAPPAFFADRAAMEAWQKEAYMNDPSITAPMSYASSPSMSEYYNKFYSSEPTDTGPTPEEAAMARAKQAAGGATIRGGSAPGSAASSVAASPWLNYDKTYW